MKRLFTQFVQTACQDIGASCDVLSDGWVLRMQHGEKAHLTLGYGFDINNAAADRIGNDKAAQYTLLEAHGIPAIAHFLARIPGASGVNRSKLPALDPHASYVTKPVDGTGGQTIVLHQTLDEAIDHINSLKTIDQSWTISPYEALVYERRLVVLDGEILLAYEKTDPRATPDGLVLFNLGLGATAQSFTPSNQEIDLAMRATRACTLRLAAVDIVGTASGEQMIMEINSGIMCETYARQSDEHYRQVQDVYRTIIQRVFAS